MRSFATYDDLKRFGSEPGVERLYKSATASVLHKTVFLSHSSDDHELVPGAVSLLENHGGRVYVDAKDSALAQSSIKEIANSLRGAVKTCRKFVLLVTPNTKQSRWIPWELGLGDGDLNTNNVALLPAAASENDQSWAEQEYLGLYQKIIWGNFSGETQNQWLVVNSDTNEGVKLRNWIST